MFKFILRRTFYSLWVILGVLLLTFLLFNLASGDPAAAILGENAIPEEIDLLRRNLGSDLPLFYGRKCRSSAYTATVDNSGRKVTFFREYPAENNAGIIKLSTGKSVTIDLDPLRQEQDYVADSNATVTGAEVCRLQESPWNSQFFKALGEIISFSGEFPYIVLFDFGYTLDQEKVSEVIARGIGPSLSLMLPIFIGEIFFGILFALISVAYLSRIPDRLLLFASVAGMSISYLVAIILGQWFFGYQLGWFPLWGFDGPANYMLPVLIGILCGTGNNIRFFRTVFADELRREYLRTATAKGVTPPVLFFKHLLGNSMIQIITRVTTGLPYLFTGSLLLESFFGIPGLGFAGIEALHTADIQLLKALVIMSSLIFVAMNLLADLAYAWADPRIRLE